MACRCKLGDCKLEKDRCCRCLDRRTDRDVLMEPVYIDQLGPVVPYVEVGIKVPRDMGYCPTCKKTRTPSYILYDRVRYKMAAKKRNERLAGLYADEMPQEQQVAGLIGYQ